MGSAVTPDLSKGGEIDGDLVITGDFKVEGAGSFAYDEIIEGTLEVDSDISLGQYIVHKGDTDSKFGFASNNRLYGYIGGADIFDFYSNQIWFNSGNADIDFQIGASGASKDAFVVQGSSGNIGISTDSPTTPLHIYQNNSVTDATGGLLIENDGTGDAVAQFLLTGVRRWIAGIDNSDSDKFKFTHGASDLSTTTPTLTMTGDNNVGISTASPTEALHVVGELALEETSSTSGLIKFRDTDQAVLGQIGLARTTNAIGSNSVNLDMVYSLEYNNKFMWNQQNTTRMTLTSTGLGVGGSHSPSAIIHAQGSNGTTLRLKNTGSALNYIQMDNSVGTNYIQGNAGSIGLYGVDDVRLIVNNNIMMKVDSNSRISLSNNDGGNTSNTIFGKSAFNASSDVGADYNSFFGEGVAGTGTLSTATGNVGMGWVALQDLTSGSDNIAIGQASGHEITTGNNNVLVGAMSGGGITTDLNVVAIGKDAYKANDVSADAEGSSGHGSGNIAVGYQSMQSFNHVDFLRNTAVGFQTMSAGTSDVAQDNTTLGYRALQLVTTGDSNTAIGSKSLKSITTGGNNTALGVGTLQNITTGEDNVAIGEYALQNAGAGELRNIAIGSSAMQSMDEGTNGNINYNIALGRSALFGADLGTGSTDIMHNIAIGTDCLRLVSGDAQEGTIAIGRQALTGLTSGSMNTAIGFEAGKVMSTQDYNTFIGYQSGRATTGSNNTAIGKYTMYEGAGADNNTALGANALQNVTSDNNTGLGFNALNAVTTGGNNVALGSNALDALTIGHSNVALGQSALGAEVVAYGITAIGYGVFNSANRSASSGSAVLNAQVGIGYLAGSATTTGNTNTFIGAYSAIANTTGSRNVTLGYSTLQTATTSNDCVAIGNEAMAWAQAGQAYSGVVAIGKNAVKGNTSSTTTAINGTVGIGMDALTSLTSGGGNLAIGYTAGSTITTASFNTYVGHESGVGDGTQHSRNTGLGYQSLKVATSGENNTAIGNQSLLALTTGSNNVAVGANALDAIDGGESHNVAVGYDAGGSINNPTGSSNYSVLIGHSAGKGGAGRMDAVVAIGGLALDSSGDNDQVGTVAIGYSALSALTTGAGNVAIGLSAGGNTATTSQSVILGYEAGATTNGDNGSNAVLIGYQAGRKLFTGHGDTIAIGHLALGSTSRHSAGSDKNIAIGSQAMEGVLASGSAYNIAIGYQAFEASTSGANNLFFGAFAGKSATTGSNNVAMGYGTLDNLTTTNNMVAIGHNAGTQVNHVQAEGGTFVGYEAGKSLGSAGHTTAIGYQALTTVTANGYNTAVGSQALKLATGINNTAVGMGSGDLIQGGVRNSLFGKDSGNVLVAGEDNTILGYQADASGSSGSHQIVIGSGATGIADNTAVIGSSSITDVYMASDATTGNTQTEGANVIARSGYFKRVGLDHDKSGTDGAGDMDDNILLTLHGAYDDDAIGGRGHGLSFKMQDESTNVGETGRIVTISRSSNMNSNLSTLGTEMYFYNRVGGTLTRQFSLSGGDGHAKATVYGNTSTQAFRVYNDGNNANRDGIYIQAGADDASGTTAYIDCYDGDGGQVGHISNTSGTFALTDVSDKRLKKDIVDTSVKGVETIDKIKVRDFEWIKSGDKMTAGFVAQELAEAFPSAVTGEDGAMEDILDEDGNKTGERIKPMGVSRDVLVPVLIKAVQELSARIKELESK